MRRRRASWAVAAGVVTAVAVVGPAGTASAATVGVTVAGGNGQGSAANQLTFPIGVAVDASGYLYVVDNLGYRVQKFPPGSTSATDGVTVAGGNGRGPAANQLANPSGVAVDGAGNVYVADTVNARVQKFPPGSSSATDGVTVAGGNGAGPDANQLSNPSGVALDSNGNLYVVDLFNHRVQEFPPGSTSATAGVTVAGGNGAGGAANQLNYPSGVAVDGAGNVYVADYYNYRVQKFGPGSTSATAGITVAGGNGVGSAANQLWLPSSVFVDGTGNLYVTDTDNNRVQQFPPGSTSATNGVTVADGNKLGALVDQLSFPQGVTVDGVGNVYVSDYGNNRVQKVPAPDTTAPTATPTQLPAANGAGWNSSDVTVSWNWSDNLGGSGIDAANCTTSSTSSGEGALTLTATCTDLAGNTGSASYSVKVDKTAPTLQVTGGPVDGGSYAFGSVPAAPSCVATDAAGGSGVDAYGCLVSGYATGVGAQKVTFTATDLAGNIASQSVSYTVTTAPQSITFAPLASPATAGTSAGLSASASSGLPVLFSIDASSTVGACRLSVSGTGPAVAYLAAGTCVVNANQPGTTVYAPAAQVQQTVTVQAPPVQSQTISFTQPTSPAVAGGTASLSATASSGLPVTFTVDGSSTTGACTVSGTTVSYTASGTCVIAANQAGNAGYAPAPTVKRSVVVTYTASGFTSPLPKSTLLRSGSNIPAKFVLRTADGKVIPSTTAAALATAKAVTVTLTGPGITATSALCTWDSTNLQFQCQIKTPTGLKTGTTNPYTLTAYLAVPNASTVGGTTVLPVTSEIVYFK